MRSTTARSNIFRPHQWDEQVKQVLETSGFSFTEEEFNNYKETKAYNAIENHLIITDYFSAISKINSNIKFEKHEKSLNTLAGVIASGYLFDSAVFDLNLDEFTIEALKEADYIIFESTFAPSHIERIPSIDGFFGAESSVDDDYSDGESIVMTVGYYIGEDDCPYDFKTMYSPKYNYKNEFEKNLDRLTEAHERADDEYEDGLIAEEIDLDKEVYEAEQMEYLMSQINEELMLSKNEGDVVFKLPSKIKAFEEFKRALNDTFNNILIKDCNIGKTDLTCFADVDFGIIIKPQIFQLLSAIGDLDQCDLMCPGNGKLRFYGAINEAGVRLTDAEE